MTRSQNHQRASKVNEMSSPLGARRQRLNSILDVIGRTLIASGLLLLAFVGYQLWGTGIAETRAQSSLERQFRSQPAAIPVYGGIVGKIEIPSIDVEKWVVAGVGYKELERGPGLFSGSPLPGQLGNVAIAGHRTTFGAPFSRIDEVKDGDVITMTTTKGSFTYIVKGAPRIVDASDVHVVKTVDKSKAMLTLVSCHPKWTSKQRIIVQADLSSTIPAQPPTVFEPNSPETEVLNEGWFHDPSAWPGVIGLALLLIGIVIGAGLIRKTGRSRWVVYPITLLIFVPVLYVFFGYLTRLLPTNL